MHSVCLLFRYSKRCRLELLTYLHFLNNSFKSGIAADHARADGKNHLKVVWQAWTCRPCHQIIPCDQPICMQCGCSNAFGNICGFAPFHTKLVRHAQSAWQSPSVARQPMCSACFPPNSLTAQPTLLANFSSCRQSAWRPSRSTRFACHPRTPTSRLSKRARTPPTPLGSRSSTRQAQNSDSSRAVRSF